MTVATMEAKSLEMVPTEKERDFALAQREATALANSSLVPKEFAGNVANALIALNLARRTGFDPLMVMQNLAVIHGRPSFSASFLVACINACGRFTPIRYRITGEGDDMTCVAVATDRETGEQIEGPPVTIKMAKDEGWFNKNGSKWKTMPALMIRYRAAAFFARTIAPEVSLGMLTAEEREDIGPVHGTSGKTAKSATEAIERARDITPPKAEGDPVEPSAAQEPFDYGDGPDDF